MKATTRCTSCNKPISNEMRPHCNACATGLIQRKGRDNDPVKPGMWCDVGLDGPCEVMSYPCPHKDANGIIDDRATLMVRTRIGDPTSLKEVPFKLTAVYCPTRHEQYYEVIGRK